MFEEGFAYSARRFKLSILPDSSPVVFTAWSRTPLLRHSLLGQGVALLIQASLLVIRLIWFVWLILFDWLRSLNQTN
jgi:hypothetical protein